MSVPGFLALVGLGAAALGGLLARMGWWWLFWGLAALVACGIAAALAMTWRPVDDDPYPALMALVIGVYGGAAAIAGLLAGASLARRVGRRDARG